MSYKTLFVSSVFAALTFSTQVFAAEIKFDGQGCYVGQVHLIQHADGFVSGSFDSGNMRLPDQYGNPLVSGHCVGTFTVINGEAESNGSCEFADAAGDKYLGVFSRKGDPAKVEGNWHVVHGTGKFAGMSEEGKFKTIGEIPPPGMAGMLGGCDHAWGTRTLK
jgi:hypothetical protein